MSLTNPGKHTRGLGFSKWMLAAVGT
uniref:Uncharacterized protein n=1 Tax=Anguilla anguilla TaxID=7936 RepID=A0A0E9V8T1_ANGAN